MVERVSRLQGVFDYQKRSIAEVAITSDERVDKRVTAIDVGGRQRANNGSGRLILRDRCCGKGDVGRDLVDGRDSQGEVGRQWERAIQGGVGDAHGDGVRVLGLVVEDCARLQVQGEATDLEAFGIYAGERQAVGSEPIVGDDDISKLDAAGGRSVLWQ